MIINPTVENPLLKKVEQKGGLWGLCPRVDPKFCSLFLHLFSLKTPILGRYSEAVISEK